MKSVKKKISTEKENGRIYTPQSIVDNILNLSDYYGSRILKKHVIDNSCGDGAFLCEIVQRYCKESIQNNLPLAELHDDLEVYIHGIEIDVNEHKKCIDNVDKIASYFGINNVKWDIICSDALTVQKYDGKMDFVLGNPPYVRIHNLGDSFNTIKTFNFSQNGMTDLFIVFYEIGIKMLSSQGTLGYITPSSFFNSLAGRTMRRLLVENNLIDKIVDLKHYQAFPSTTYTTIAILKKEKESNNLDYYEYDEKNCIPYYVDSLSPDDYYVEGNYFFSYKENLAVLKKILSNFNTADVLVKNGYATLDDTVFIHDFDFESKFIIPAIKASKGTRKKIFFPYDSDGKLIPEEQIQKDEKMYAYLIDNKASLTQRSHEKKDDKYWYAFGRSQAINDTFKNKLAINALIRTPLDLKFSYAPAGVGVYSGLYITSDSIPFEKITEALLSDEFLGYVSLLGKYKSGGYYTFSSKDLKAFLDYKFNCQGDHFEC